MKIKKIFLLHYITVYNYSYINIKLNIAYQIVKLINIELRTAILFLYLDDYRSKNGTVTIRYVAV